MKLGEQIKLLRVRQGLTQSELAERIKSTKSSISNYERNLTVPPYAVLHAIAGALSVPASELLACTADSPDTDSDAESRTNRVASRVGRERRLLAAFSMLTDEAKIKVIKYAEDLGLASVYRRSMPVALQEYVSSRCRCEFDSAEDTENEESCERNGETWKWRARHMVFCRGQGQEMQRWDFFYYTFDYDIRDLEAIWNILNSAESSDRHGNNIVFVFDDKETFGRFYDVYCTNKSKESKRRAEGFEEHGKKASALFLMVEKMTWEILDEKDYYDPYK